MIKTKTKYIFLGITSIYMMLVHAVLLQAEPEKTLDTHYLGVGSCASSNCHGNVKEKNGFNASLNEYVIWKQHDSHAKAWSVLRNSDSKMIGKHLGISNPEEDKNCLSCHSTSLAGRKAGNKFYKEDGVGCESCHGPASGWIKSHAEKATPHSDNLKNGMTDLLDPVKRTNLCLSCHLGSADKEFNHRLIGAGHPRLTFEVETFSQIQPAHWKVDSDYIVRKGDYDAVKFWYIGQLSRGIESLKLLAQSLVTKESADFSFSYCYSCHHSLSDDQWKKREYHGNPGTLNFNVSSLIVLTEALKILDVKKGVVIENKLKELNVAEDKHQKIKSLISYLENEILADSKNLKIKPNEITKIRAGLKNLPVKKPYLPYEVAEQILMGISVLNESSFTKAQLEEIYKVLEKEEEFKPEKFSEVIRRLGK